MSHALIIEDEFLIAALIEDALSTLGYSSFDFASTAADAIAVARRCCPDLIIADNRLSIGTGVEAVRAICSDKSIPVVFVTATPEDVSEAFESAIILSKPINHRMLGLAVARAVAAPFAA